jgi:hypothetical protein
MRIKNIVTLVRVRLALNVLFAGIIVGAVIAGFAASRVMAQTGNPSADQTFTEASQKTGVPVALLKAICYEEGRLSNNGGESGSDNGFGCMNLAKNQHTDTLDQAASDLRVSTADLKQNLDTNIEGGAAVLRDKALQVSSTHTLPASLGNWYSTLLAYSASPSPVVEAIFAKQVYKVIQEGFSAPTDRGETVTLVPEAVQPNISATSASSPTFFTTSGQSRTTFTPGSSTTKQTDSAMVTTVAQLANDPASTCESGQTDSNVDYPGAIDCILAPTTLYDCNSPTSPSNCNYTGSDRPTSCSVWVAPDQPLAVTKPCNVDQVVIHDTDGSLDSALDEFLCLGASSDDSACVQSSVNYIIDTDGTVYQVVHESDIAYHDGNFWSNMHSIGIEHVGYDATGYLWYNTAQYRSSAKLVAYLLKKYHLPLNRDHVVAHGTVAASTLGTSPNHVDPGPYWLWDYYFGLISQQGVPWDISTPRNTITLHPETDRAPAGPHGTESSSQYNFFNLYTEPSTASALIPAQDTSDPTDVSYNVEAGMSYYYLAKAPDRAGTGDTMYEIWYGIEDQVQTSSSYFADGGLAWLAVPPGDGVEGLGTFSTSSVVKIVGGTADIYSRPQSNSAYVIGNAPNLAVFYSGYTVLEDGTSNLWYEINYNHRQAWVPASEITLCTLK